MTGKTFAPAPADSATTSAALLIEVLFTLALALVVLNSAASAKTHGNSFYGIAIGFTIVVAAAAGGPISGGRLQSGGRHRRDSGERRLGGGTWANLWLYLVGPLAGGALAAWIFGLQEREPVQLHAEPSRTTGEPAGIAAGLSALASESSGPACGPPSAADIRMRHRNAQPAAAPAG